MDIRPEQATAVALLGMGAFQALLAAGAPWGNLSWGGTHRGTLPDRLRTGSAAAAVAYIGAAAFITSGAGTRQLRVRTFTAISFLMGTGTIANALSRSSAERLVWTPATAVITGLAWRSRRWSVDHRHGSADTR